MREVFEVFVVAVASFDYDDNNYYTTEGYDVKSIHKSRETAHTAAMVMARELVEAIMEGAYEGMEGILIDMYEREGNPLHGKINEIVAANWSDRKDIVDRVITDDDRDTMAKAMIELDYVGIMKQTLVD
jgi:hypothetical protein